MAKRKGAARRDVYANRYRGRLTFGADASVWAYESFNTGISMTGMQPHKWDILWAFIGPNKNDDMHLMVDGTQMSFQIAFGTQVAMLECDDMQVVATTHAAVDIVASGGATYQYPLRFPIASPLVCLASVITVGGVIVNNAEYNSTDWYYEIGYITRPTSANEAAEFFAQVGAL